MRSKLFLAGVSCAVFFGIVAFDVQSDNGIAGRTGSPGETLCNGCHTGSPLNDGTGSVSISSPNMTNWEYVPGQTYQIDVTVSRSGNPLFGFGCEALTTSNQNGGTIVVTNTVETTIKNAVISSVTRRNIVHKLNGGASSDAHVFSFDWTAPASGTGNVKFYVGAVAANANGQNSGDHVYSASQLVTELGAGFAEAGGNKLGLRVFPVPASDYLEVNFTAGPGETVTGTLYTIAGKPALSCFT